MVELTAAHWVYALFIILVLITMALRRETGEERSHAGDVAVVLSGLIGGAEVDILDLRSWHTGALERLTDDEGGEVVGPLAGERAPVAPDGRAHGGEDDGLGHDGSVRIPGLLPARFRAPLFTSCAPLVRISALRWTAGGGRGVPRDYRSLGGAPAGAVPRAALSRRTRP